jgi:hypothetical protein
MLGHLQMLGDGLKGDDISRAGAVEPNRTARFCGILFFDPPCQPLPKPSLKARMKGHQKNQQR